MDTVKLAGFSPEVKPERYETYEIILETPCIIHFILCPQLVGFRLETKPERNEETYIERESRRDRECFYLSIFVSTYLFSFSFSNLVNLILRGK